MNENLKQTESRKTWFPPALTIYGNVEELTQGSPEGQGKQLGSGDDVLTQQNVGISNFP